MSAIGIVAFSQFLLNFLSSLLGVCLFACLFVCRILSFWDSTQKDSGYGQLVCFKVVFDFLFLYL